MDSARTETLLDDLLAVNRELLAVNRAILQTLEGAPAATATAAAAVAAAVCAPVEPASVPGAEPRQPVPDPSGDKVPRPTGGSKYDREAVRLIKEGQDLYERGLADDAMASLRSALAIMPGYADAHCYVGKILSKEKKDHDGAIHEFLIALEINPNYADAYFGLATCYEALNRNDQAIEAWQNFLDLDPSGGPQGKYARDHLRILQALRGY